MVQCFFLVFFLVEAALCIFKFIHNPLYTVPSAAAVALLCSRTATRFSCLYDAFLIKSHLAVSAPFVINVLISSSCPYLAATCRGVLPYLSAQSISPPVENMEENNVSQLSLTGSRWLCKRAGTYHFELKSGNE